jgi:hypothetical protein
LFFKLSKAYKAHMEYTGRKCLLLARGTKPPIRLLEVF